MLDTPCLELSRALVLMSTCPVRALLVARLLMLWVKEDGEIKIKPSPSLTSGRNFSSICFYFCSVLLPFIPVTEAAT